MDNPFKSPAIISFCPGILGIERGLKRAGVHPRVVAYVEIEAYIIANLVAGMEAGMVDPAPIWTDAKTFDARPFRGKIHGIIGGYPCPGESLAGLREGHLYKGFLWPAIRRAIAATRPLFCFFENVDDHLTGTYPIVQRSLHNMGYQVEAGVYSAEEVGTPHERERLFILVLDDTKGIDWGLYLRQWASFESKTNTTGAGEELVNTQSVTEREQADQTDTLPIERRTRDEFINRSDFVAGQGNFQYEWEEPRTIKPGMGCTINGYNFREDLLRALGNSVVEQTAELAFIDLLKKHLKNLK